MPQRFIHPPRVTPGVNLPRYYTPTLRLLLSPLLYFFSSCRSLSGFSRVRLCLCLSICVFICLTHIHLSGDAIVGNASVIKAMRGNHPPSDRLSRLYLEYTQRHTTGCICWTILGRKHNLKWILSDSDVHSGNILVYLAYHLMSWDMTVVFGWVQRLYIEQRKHILQYKDWDSENDSHWSQKD